MTVTIRSNEYWGRRSGAVTKEGPVLRLKRGGGSSSDNKGPSGRRSNRWYAVLRTHRKKGWMKTKGKHTKK